MPSLHDTLMRRFGAPLILHQHGESSDDGEAVILATPPNAKPIEWSGIVGALQIDDFAGNDAGFGSHETRNKRQTTTATIATPVEPVLKETKVVVTKFGPTPFSIDSIDRGDALTTIRLSRPLPEYIGRRTTH